MKLRRPIIFHHIHFVKHSKDSMIKSRRSKNTDTDYIEIDLCILYTQFKIGRLAAAK